MAQQQFDPINHISKIKGQDYLEVKWRIAWMRSEHPMAKIETNLVSHVDGQAIVRSVIELPEGGMATGYGSENVQAFDNYIEKAETKSIGRALTALGYGTPIPDETEAAEIERAPQQQPPSTIFATAAQKSRIQRIANELRLNESDLDELVQQHTGGRYADLNKRQASGMIDLLESRRQQQQAS